MKAQNKKNRIKRDYSLFNEVLWNIKKYDYRLKNTLFAGMTKDEYLAASAKHQTREINRGETLYLLETKTQKYLYITKFFDEIPTLENFKGDGLSDWEYYKQNTTKGVRAICPGESGNDYELLPNTPYDELAIKHIRRVMSN